MSSKRHAESVAVVRCSVLVRCLDWFLNKTEGILLSLEEGECTYQARLADLRSQNPHLLVLKGTETVRLDAQTPCLALGHLPGQEQARYARLLGMCKRWRSLALRRLRLVRVFSWRARTPNEHRLRPEAPDGEQKGQTK